MLILPRMMNSLGSPLLAGAQLGQLGRLDGYGVGTDGVPPALQRAIGVTLGLLLLSFTAGWMLWWAFPVSAGVTMVRNFGLAAGVLAFSLAFVASLKPQWSLWLAPLYAIASGLFVVGLASALDVRFPGIALQSAAITLAVFGVMLVLYAGRWLRATPRFRLAVYAATVGIALVYLLALLASVSGWPLVWLGEQGNGVVLWHAFVALTAALNLVLDFERIERLSRQSPPDYMIWYTALGLLVTLVWMYVSILRLLASLRR